MPFQRVSTGEPAVIIAISVDLKVSANNILFLTSTTRERLDLQMYPLVPLEIVIPVLPIDYQN